MSSCPRCATPLHDRVIADLVLHECARCDGVFLDRAAIEAVTGDTSHARADALLAALPRKQHATVPGDGKMYVKCPACSTLMNRKLFATGSGIVVDVCKQHGTFFDGGELPAIIDFVLVGGMVKAQGKDAERARGQAQLAKASQQQHKASVVRAENERDAETYLDAGSVVVDLLFSIFR